MKDSAAANTMDRHTVNQVGTRLPRADGPREKAEGVRLDSGVSEPANVGADPTGHLRWQQWYGTLWEFKLAFDKKHNG